MILEGTAANTNVAYDIGTYAGTFWTAVGSTSPGTYGLKAIKDIQVAARTFIYVGGTGINGNYQGAAAAAGVYTLIMNATNTNIPDILFASGSAPTAFKIVLQWSLLDGETPIEVYAAA